MTNPHLDTKTARKSLTGLTRQPESALPLNRCTDECVRPTPSQAHCAARGCHRTFGGVWGFDKHRRNGVCLNPSDLAMVLTNGIWRRPMSDDVRESFTR